MFGRADRERAARGAREAADTLGARSKFYLTLFDEIESRARTTKERGGTPYFLFVTGAVASSHRFWHGAFWRV